MDLIDPSAGPAHSEVSSVNNVGATSKFATPRPMFGKLIEGAVIPRSLTSLFLTATTSDSAPTAILRPSLFESGTLSQTVAKVSRAIHTNGGLLIVVIRSTSWRLQIQSQTTMPPKHSGTASSEFEHPEAMIALKAKLFAQPAQKADSNSSAARVWHATATRGDVEATSSFLRTVVLMSSTLTGKPKSTTP